MKKLIYLSVCMLLATALVSCNKLNDTYKAIDALPGTPKSLTYTMTVADYTSLPNTAADTAYKTHSFPSVSAANTYIPVFLNTKFFDYPNKSTANITYNAGITLPDSVYKDEAYTLSTVTGSNDYLLYPGNKYNDFSVAQLLTWLTYKFPTPAANQAYLLTWIYYPTISATAPQIVPGLSVSTTGSVTTATGAFFYFNNNWTQAYLITPAQYAASGRGQYNEFTTADAPNLVSIFNTILKADPSVMATAAVGTTQYVSFNYYVSSTADYQRLMPLTYNGTNWVSATNTIGLVKINGSWVPSVNYTITTKDIALLNGTTVNTATPIANVIQYGDFNIQSSSQYYWSPAQLTAAITLILKADFPNPKVNVPYNITYQVYNGANVYTTVTFLYDGTNWNQQ